MHHPMKGFSEIIMKNERRRGKCERDWEGGGGGATASRHRVLFASLLIPDFFDTVVSYV